MHKKLPATINILPEQLANKIAAGEVVQRPDSVVKELSENSIDAGARSIGIIVKDGGKTFIQISDDGSGMSEEDSHLAFGDTRRARSARTKISRISARLDSGGKRWHLLPRLHKWN